jgi:hypothetical protein
MVRLQLVWRDEPVPIIQSDGIDTNEVEEWDAENPAVSEEEAHWYHADWHIHVCQKVNPDDTISVISRIKYGRSWVTPIVPNSIPVL